MFNIPTNFLDSKPNPTVADWQEALSTGKTKATSYDAFLKEYYSGTFMGEQKKFNAGLGVTPNPDGSLSTNFGTEIAWQNPIDTEKEQQNLNMATSVTAPGFQPTISENTEPVDSTSTDNQTKSGSNSFWNYLAKNPMLGMGLSIEDRFRIAGQSFAYDPSFITDSKEESRADRVRKLTGIAGIGSGLLGATRNFLQGYGEQKRMNEGMNEYFNNLSKLNTNDYMFKFESGGTFGMPKEKLLSNEYISGLPKAMEELANSELEEKEFVKFPDGTIQKVWGNTHKEGGEKVILEEGTNIISDNLKLDREIAKSLTDQYGIKFSTKDTFAKALERISDKIGLTELNMELEEKLKQIVEQEKLSDENTKKLNISFLKEEIFEIERKRADLLGLRSQAFDDVFRLQEMVKFRDGGTYKGSKFEAMCKKHGLTKEEGLKMLSESYMKDGGTHKNKWISAKIKKLMDEGKPQKQAVAIAISMYENRMEDGGRITVHKGDKKVTKDKKTGQESNTWNATTMDEDQVNELAKTLGFFDSSEYADASKPVNERFQTFLYNNFPDVIQEKHQDYGQPNKGMFDGNLGVRWTSALAEIAKTVSKPVTGTATTPENKTVEPTAQSPFDNLSIINRRKTQGMMFVPGAFNLPPEGLIPSAMREFRTTLADPMAVSPDENLRENFRSMDTANEAISNAPMGIRTSATANNLATIVEANNRAFVAANQANQSNAQQTENFNVNLINADETYRYNEIPRYESLSLTAYDKTLKDIRNYINTSYNNQLKKYNFINNANIISSMFDNVAFDPFGVPTVDPNTVNDFYVTKPR